MKYIFISLLMLITFTAVFSQDQRALVIGIDTYAPPDNAKISPSSARLNWPTLDGCKNDADLVKAVILSRFGFSEKNVVEISNMEATRNNILKDMEDLLTASKKNDIAFIIMPATGAR